MSKHCPVCDSPEVWTIGPILHLQPTLIAGSKIDLGDLQFSLRGCRRCEFQFKFPSIPAEKLMACYANSDSANWESDPDPYSRKFDLLQNLVEAHSPGRRVLDIGCFNGALLASFGESWQKYGIEPSSSAARLAESRGVQILASTLEHVDRGVAPFDAVIAIDVVEHLSDPLDFFRRASALVAPGGVLVILTGDTGSLAWRLQRSMYWYCSLPEHISFYNKKSLDFIGERIGMHGIEYRRLSHGREPFHVWFADMFKSAVYIVGRKVRGFGIPALRRWFVDRRGPSVCSARDHLIYIFRKPA